MVSQIKSINTMFYKITKEKPLYRLITTVFDLAKANKKTIREWVEAQGAKDYVCYTRGLVNMPYGLIFETEPQKGSGWRYHKQNKCWVTENSRTGNKLCEEMKALPVMDYKPLTTLLLFSTYAYGLNGSMYTVSCPEVFVGEEAIGVKFPPDYNKPMPADLEEITASEYKKLMPV